MRFSHGIHFYDEDAAFKDRTMAYVDARLSARSSVIVIARPPLLNELKDRWLPRYHNRFIGLDASKALSSFMVHGKPNGERFIQGIGCFVLEAASHTRHVYVFGELVAMLWEEGKCEAALDVEHLWNELGAYFPLTVLCAFRADAFSSSQQSGKLQICGAHSDVVSLQAGGG